MTVKTHGRSGYNRGCKCDVCVLANRMHRYISYGAERKGEMKHACCGLTFTDHGYNLHLQYIHGDTTLRKGE